MAELLLALLGPLSVVYDRRPLTQFRTRSVQGLLAYLVCRRHQVHSREALMTLFWPDILPTSARANLRHTLHHLRQAIPIVSNDTGTAVPFVLADRHTIQLNQDGHFQLDLNQFEALTVPEATGTDLETAISLYRDDFLAGFYLPGSSDYENWIQERQTHYRRRCLDALARVTQIHIGSGDLHQAARLARRQLELDNLREEAHGQLMRILALDGRRTDAISHFQSLCQLLQDELGIAPSAETEALAEAIRSGRLTAVTKGDETAKAGDVTGPVPRSLPTQATPFIGRQAELAELDSLLTDGQTRLVTILGSGGMGKTRLAAAAAEKLAMGQQFPHGVFFVPLAGLAESERLSSTIAESLQLRLEHGETQLVNYLGSKQILLVLDNFEHLLFEVDLVSRLLAAAPDLKILTTSRERLRLHGEQLFPIQGLAVDSLAATDDARELFLQAARRNRPDFHITEENLPSLNKICSLVEGMPLALELAAAWLDMLTLSDIAAEIQRNLDFLETDLRDMPRRHRSMRAVFDTSWQQLAESEQRLLAQVSIFRGGFTREAVEAVTQASVRDLARLVSKSLLSFVGENGRYHMHELLRQYGAVHLREADQLLERYSSYYCQRLVSHKEALHNTRQAESVNQIQADMDNLRKAIAWRVDLKQFAELQPTLAVLYDFYVVRGKLDEAVTLFNELARQLERQPNSAPHTFAWLLIWLSSLNGMLSQKAEADRLWKRAREELRHPVFQSRDTRAERAAVLFEEAYSLFRWESEHSAQLFRKAAALFEEIDDHVFLAHSLIGLGRALRNQGDFPGALDAFSRGLAISQRLGDPLLQLELRLALCFQGIIAGHPERAEAALESLVAQIRLVNHPERLHQGLRFLSMAQMMNGRFAAALRTTQERRQVEKESGSFKSELLQESMARALINLHLGQYEKASEVEQALAQPSPDQYFISDAFLVSGLAAIARGDLAAASVQLEASRAHYVGDWVCSWIHRYEIGLALTAVMRGEFTTAHQLIQSELQLYVEKYKQERAGTAPISFVLAVLSYTAAAQGQSERAIRLYALARRSDFVASSRWVADVIGEKITAVSTTLPPSAAASAQSHGRELDLMETAEVILAEWSES